MILISSSMSERDFLLPLFRDEHHGGLMQCKDVHSLDSSDNPKHDERRKQTHNSSHYNGNTQASHNTYCDGNAQASHKTHTIDSNDTHSIQLNNAHFSIPQSIHSSITHSAHSYVAQSIHASDHFPSSGHEQPKSCSLIQSSGNQPLPSRASEATFTESIFTGSTKTFSISLQLYRGVRNCLLSNTGNWPLLSGIQFILNPEVNDSDFEDLVRFTPRHLPVHLIVNEVRSKEKIMKVGITAACMSHSHFNLQGMLLRGPDHRLSMLPASSWNQALAGLKKLLKQPLLNRPADLAAVKGILDFHPQHLHAFLPQLARFGMKRSRLHAYCCIRHSGENYIHCSS